MGFGRVGAAFVTHLGGVQWMSMPERPFTKLATRCLWNLVGAEPVEPVILGGGAHQLS